MKNNGQLRAVLTGVAGQDGSYLAEYLLEKGYMVYGVSRRKSTNNGLDNIKDILSNEYFHLIKGDITDSTFISRILYDIRPHEFYNLAAMSNVGQSFVEPVSTFEVNASAVITQLELIRQITPSTRYYQASSISFEEPVMIKVDDVVKMVTLGDAYELWNKKSFNSYQVLTMDDEGKSVFSNVKDVIDHGLLEAYEIDLYGGKILTVSGDHSLINMKNEVF